MKSSAVLANGREDRAGNPVTEVQCPKYIQQAIVGHGVKDITDNYGQGYSLQVKLEWLERIALVS